MIFRRLTLVLRLSILLGACAISAQAQAAITYSFRFDQTDYLVAPDGMVDVNVYLVEKFESGDPTLLNTEGLFGAGVRVFFNEAPVPSDPAEVLSVGDVAPNPGFDGFAAFDWNANVSAGFSASVDVISPPVVASSPDPFTNEILLGTFTFKAGLVAGEVTHIRATDFDLSTDDNVTLDTFTVLDGLISDSTATITVSGASVVTPEPTTLAVWSGLTMVCALFWRRRQFRSAVT